MSEGLVMWRTFLARARRLVRGDEEDEEEEEEKEEEENWLVAWDRSVEPEERKLSGGGMRDWSTTSIMREDKGSGMESWSK